MCGSDDCLGREILGLEEAELANRCWRAGMKMGNCRNTVDTTHRGLYKRDRRSPRLATRALPLYAQSDSWSLQTVRTNAE